MKNSNKHLLLLGGQNLPTYDVEFLSGSLGGGLSFARASAGEYFDSSGVMQSALTDTARFDYDPSTLAMKGLLIEQQSTNLDKYSVPDSNWTTTNVTASLNTAEVTAPDGTSTAAKITEDTSTDMHLFYPPNMSGGCIEDATYTLSVYVKAGSATIVQLVSGQVISWAAYANFNLSSGTVAKTSSCTASIEDAGNGWYRISINVVSMATNGWTQPYGIGFTNQNTNAARRPSYTGDGTSYFYVWGGQAEEGSVLTSYIPTSGTAVTRAADHCCLLNPSWHNSSEFSLICDFLAPSVLSTYGYASVFDDGTTSNLIGVGLNASNAPLFGGIIGGVTTISAEGSAVSGGSLCRIGVAVKNGANIGAANGVALGAGDAGAADFADTCVNLRVGNGSGLNRALNGHIIRVRYFPYALSQSALNTHSAI